MENFKTPQDLANDLAAATQTLPAQHGSCLDHTGGDALGVDFTDPISVHAAICRVHPFGDILLLEGIAEACRRGQGQTLFQQLTPAVVPQFDVAINEIMPTIEFIASFTCLQTRAEMICRTHFFGECAVSRALIEEVADAGPLGALAQAYLYPPVKPKRRPRVGRHSSPRRRAR